MNVQVIIPIYRPDEKWRKCLSALQRQSQAFSLLILDSGSEQAQWLDEATPLHPKVVTIDPRHFDHGGTRQYGIELALDADFYVFLTQDAIPADGDTIKNIITAFSDVKVGCAYGRQLPHSNADIFSAHARAFNYPADSHVYTYEDHNRHGMKTAFNSNSFAAYRRSAMETVGGFPTHTILSEDMYVAAKMLQLGWSIAYVAEAAVYHSHNYSIAQEFHRYFDIGVFHHRESWIRNDFGQAEGEGGRFVIDEVKLLLKKAPWNLPNMIFRDAAKFTGYRMGLLEDKLTTRMRLRLAWNRKYFVK